MIHPGHEQEALNRHVDNLDDDFEAYDMAHDEEEHSLQEEASLAQVSMNCMSADENK